MLLAFSLVLSFVGCNEKIADDEKASKKDDSIDEATKVVEDFMDALCDFNIKKMTEYTDEEEFLEEIGVDSIDEAKEELLNEQLKEFESQKKQIESHPDPEIKSAAISYLNTMEKLSKDFSNETMKVFKSFNEYDIDEVEDDNGKIKFKVVFEAMDYKDNGKKMQDVANNIDYESIGASIGITEPPQNGSAQYFKLMEAAMSQMMEQQLEVLKESDSKEIAIELIVEEKDDEWIIIEKDSDFDDIVDLIKEQMQ